MWLTGSESYLVGHSLPPEIPAWETVMAEQAFRLLPGTAVLAQGEPKTEHNGILLSDMNIGILPEMQWRIGQDWKENDWHRVIAVNNTSPRDIVRRVLKERTGVIQEAQALSNRELHVDAWPDHEFHPGDIVLVNRRHGVRFEHFYCNTPGGAHYCRSRLRFVGRGSANLKGDLGLSTPCIVPLARTMPIILNTETKELRATGDNVIFVLQTPQTTTESGLHVPSVLHKRELRGVVLSVGPLVTSVVPGDEIIYRPDCKTTVATQGSKMKLGVMPEAGIVSLLGHIDNWWEEYA